MEFIIKRDGSRQEYSSQKIISALEKVFISTKYPIEQEKLDCMLDYIESDLVLYSANPDNITVEHIQDVVEETLMKFNYLVEAKEYILYRKAHNDIRKIRKSICDRFPNYTELSKVFVEIQRDFPQEEYDISVLNHMFNIYYKSGMNEQESFNALIKATIELVSVENPLWDYIAARLQCYKINKDIELGFDNVYNFYDKIKLLTSEGIYNKDILSSYSEYEINTASSMIDNNKNNLFTYSGIDLLSKRYLIKMYSHKFNKYIPIETPQELFLGIALHLAINEKKESRMNYVKDFYDVMSSLYVTVATPTLANCRKSFHQLSSCFIDVMPDSLDGIYNTITNFAQVSKHGGGMGIYIGKVRAAGSPIRNVKGASGGIIRWLKLINDTAIAVDQLGVRQGAVAVYLDVWHKDILDFLQIRTNNGDDRMKAHDIFPAISYPNLFWETAKNNIDADWALMCPYDIKTTMGYCLEDYYGKEWEEKYLECIENPNIDKKYVKIKDLIRLILKSVVETGTPFTFNRDTVNEMNPNSHQGIIYCSNLCTEIAQNISEIKHECTEKINHPIYGEVVVSINKPNDFVVCNLASLVLGNIPIDNDDILKHILYTVVRMLDNGIDINQYPLEYAKHTNERYRAIGIGVSGYHHLLAKNGIIWESDEHLKFIDKIFKKINQYAIMASSDLALERGSYKLFDGSDWQTGKYFEKRKLEGDDWNFIKDKVAKDGLRNGYLMAIAPTGSTSIIAGTTAGVDPIMKKFFIEEKRGSMLPRIAPELNKSTFWLYKDAHTINQEWSLRANSVRYKYIDQAQSMNLYITNDYTLSEVLKLFIKSYDLGNKTIYYVRSKSLEVEECEYCSS